MMSGSAPRLSALGGALVMVGAFSVATSARFVDFPPVKSGPAVKELIGLLDGRKLVAFAARDSDPYKFVAVSYSAGAEMFGVSATYERPGDLDYFLARKDYKSIYESLRASVTSTDRFVVDDAEANGLVPQPKRSQPDDDALFGMARKTFDGVFSDPKHADPKKPSFDDYLKGFTDADDRYTHILTVVIEELKKT
jgi:hypothetical protein